MPKQSKLSSFQGFTAFSAVSGLQLFNCPNILICIYVLHTAASALQIKLGQHEKLADFINGSPCQNNQSCQAFKDLQLSSCSSVQISLYAFKYCIQLLQPAN
jgi:hypothetical protein